MSTHARGRPLLPLLLLAVIVAVGAWVRLAGLDAQPFSEDELNHVFAARSLDATGEPALPSGWHYLRGLDFTRLVQLSQTRVADPELAARLPSALAGTAGLVLMAIVAWRLVGPWAAVWATLLLALFPHAVIESRRSRFYAWQMTWLLVALFAGWRALAGAGSATSASPTARRTAAVRWLWLLLALLGFGIAYRAQQTTASVAAGYGVALVVAAGADLLARRRAAWRSSVPLQATALVAVTGLTILVLQPGLPASLWATAMFPGMGIEGGGDPRTYYWAISGPYPVLAALVPLVFVAGFMLRPRLTAFLLAWFAVPFLLHALVFPWKAGRFLAGGYPALFIAAGLAAAAACGLLHRAVLARLEAAGAGVGADARGSGRRHAMARLGAGAIVAVVALGAVVTSPGTRRSLGRPAGAPWMGWHEAAAILDEHDPLRRFPLGAPFPLQALEYMGRVDFTVGANFRFAPLDVPPLASGHPPQGGGAAVDRYTGRALLLDPAAIRHAYPDADTLAVVVYESGPEEWMLPALLDALAAEGREVCAGRCPQLRLYLWAPHGSHEP